MEIIYSLLKTTRPINVILALLSSVVSLFTYNFLSISNITCIYYHPTLVYGFLVIIFYTAAANTINDLYDIESDKISTIYLSGSADPFYSKSFSSLFH